MEKSKEKKSDEEQTEEGGEKFGYQTINGAKNMLFIDNIFEIFKSALVDA